MTEIDRDSKYQVLIDKIGDSYNIAKSKILNSVNTQMLTAYWEIGRSIVEFQQHGRFKA